MKRITVGPIGWFLATFVLFGCLCASAGAETGRRALQGLKGVYVSVEKLEADIERDGLTRTALEQDAISALRRGGIKVLTREEWMKEPGNPNLHLNANILKLRETGEYIYAISIALRENVYLTREAIEIPEASSWSKGGVIGITGNLQKIRNSVKAEVEAFVNACRSQNPR
jgi:hypothetical protein